MGNLGIIKLLENNAKKYPKKLFLVSDNEGVTFEKAYEIVKESALKYTFKNKPVIVKVDRTIHTILNFLAVVYSGNFYVPIDINTTDEKLELINNQINNLDVSKYNDILYVVFTSGSTGIPKGVIKSESSILKFVDNFVKTFNIGSDEVIANQSPFMFDASAKDIYLSLYLGCTLHILKKELFSFPSSLIEYLNTNKITFISWVPSALIILARLKAFEKDVPKYLKYIFFVGEEFPTKYINYFLQKLPDVMITNIYGSSETAGVVLYYTIPKNTIFSDLDTLPLGKPIGDNIVYLSDDNEILVKSKQVALGYVNDDMKNKLTFVDGVLHTGDYGKYDKDNNIVFSTRKDFQIKHLGYRIELQEIEHYANTLSYIDISVCVYNSTDKKIILAVVPNKTAPTDVVASTIIDLKKILPFYMVPNKIVVLSNIQLNSNGKLDRQQIKNQLIG